MHNQTESLCVLFNVSQDHLRATLTGCNIKPPAISGNVQLVSEGGKQEEISDEQYFRVLTLESER